MSGKGPGMDADDAQPRPTTRTADAAGQGRNPLNKIKKHKEKIQWAWGDDVSELLQNNSDSSVVLFHAEHSADCSACPCGAGLAGVNTLDVVVDSCSLYIICYCFFPL